MSKEIDLLNLVDQGGCSAKLPAEELKKVLEDLPRVSGEDILVQADTHDDAGVIRIREDYALIQTTDFFPPVCSDPYDFGQVAAANALSDVYAMGGQVLSALNIVLFPTSLPLAILKEILRGGQEKVNESGGYLLGGHTITDDVPTYGLSVTGWCHPDQVVTNAAAEPGDVLLLTKPLGTGIVIAARKNNLAPEDAYIAALESMKKLNDGGARIMVQHKIRAATDITGFGLLGHGLKMAQASKVSLRIKAGAVKALPDVMQLIDMGCIPGAAFRNQEYCESLCSFDNTVDYNEKMLLYDAQTSGGLLMAVKPDQSEEIIRSLHNEGYAYTSLVGEVITRQNKDVFIDA
jgi:selenide,water dikinase